MAYETPLTKKKRPLDTDPVDIDHRPSTSFDYWPRFIVLETIDKSPLKLNPFAVSKGIQGIAGDVKNVRRLRNGSLLIECLKRQQATNLLSTKSFIGIPVSVSAHRTLNTSKGIVRDRERLFADMLELDIVSEMKEQGVLYVKRFTIRKNNEVQQTNTYLFSFSTPTAPTSIKAGYCNIKVETYIPNPLRCFKCQKFGHGVNTCTLSVVCAHCGEKTQNNGGL